MKLLALFLVLALAGQAPAQTRDDFVDYLLQLQFVTEYVYVYITDYFAASRAELSVLLTELNDQGITEITHGLHVVVDVHNRTEEAIAAALERGNAECVAEATEQWPSLLELMGTMIADCADEHVEPIHNETEFFHLYIQQQNRVAFDVQNMIVNAFTHLSPLTTPDDITPTISDELDVLIAEFEDVVRPEIERILADIRHLRDDVPEEVHGCMENALEGFTNVSGDIVNNLVNC